MTKHMAPELISLRERGASLVGTKCHTSNFCRHFFQNLLMTIYCNLLQSILPAGTFFSDLRSQAQNTFSEACMVLRLSGTTTVLYPKVPIIESSTLLGLLLLGRVF